MFRNSKAFYLIGFIGLAGIGGCQKSHHIVRTDYHQFEVTDSLPVDSSLVRYYLPYKYKMESEMSRVIGRSVVAITGGKGPETLLGNFFSDALLNRGQQLESKIDFTFSTRGGLRNALPKGNLTIGNIFELMPFENEILLLKLSGQTTAKLLNYIANSEGQPVSGLRMVVDNHQPKEVLIGGEAFDSSRDYYVLTYDYLYNSGGDLAFLSEALESRTVGKRLREAIIEYIEDQTRAGNEIEVQLDGRIRLHEN
ncbi:5'-nucleotidase C-terminal domain-containing protein [Dyadobacter tibetensis]|uniref:5'-nucleotidase C-terminal domain-containing protein n=1 Tax=Dyadobacter tibetensis TaxID=1211851 RepID=UPI00046E5CF9|nr:5'-nucleotidase [Dyadobacter tibetensis]